MKYLFQHQGKPCAAKTVFTLAFMTCLVKILFAGVTYNGLSLTEADYTGMAAFLTPLAALYWGRANTKAGEKQ